jgi:hypothetical protein
MKIHYGCNVGNDQKGTKQNEVKAEKINHCQHSDGRRVCCDGNRDRVQTRDAREVSLLGSADFAFWKRYLQKEYLLPMKLDGKARIWIIASAQKFMRIRFTEVSFAILLSEESDFARQPAAFLMQAFGSFRPFVWCERAMFNMPSQHAECSVSVSDPVSIQLRQRNEVVFGATMNAKVANPPCEPSELADSAWDGPVFLPRDHSAWDGDSLLFFSRVEGLACTRPFVSGEDMFFLEPASQGSIFRTLVESQFTPTVWSVRADATHSKSRTYQRSAFG